VRIDRRRPGKERSALERAGVRPCQQRVIGLVGGGLWLHATDNDVLSGDRQVFLDLAERWTGVVGGADGLGE
jgi:hypothetical protein